MLHVSNWNKSSALSVVGALYSCYITTNTFSSSHIWLRFSNLQSLCKLTVETKNTRQSIWNTKKVQKGRTFLHKPKIVQQIENVNVSNSKFQNEYFPGYCCLSDAGATIPLLLWCERKGYWAKSYLQTLYKDIRKNILIVMCIFPTLCITLYILYISPLEEEGSYHFFIYFY